MLDRFTYGAAEASEFTTNTLPSGTLYWRVRAHDENYNFGSWSAARTLRIA